jgi:capsular polysaccharide transport system permease protein
MTDGFAGYALSWRDWAEAARLQLRVIAALMRRETRDHFGERRLGYLWAIIEPGLHLAMYMVMWTYIFRRYNPVGGSMPLFVATGLVPYFLYYKLATYLSSAVESNRPLLNLPPVKVFDVLAARAVVEATTYLLAGVALLTILLLVGDGQAIPCYPLTLAEAIAVIVAFGFGVGMINAVLREFIRAWPTIYMISLAPLYLLSGIFFVVDEVPRPARGYLLYNPLLHLVIWFRSGFYPDYSQAYLDRGYAITWSVCALVIGFVLVRVARRKLLEPS